VTRAYIGLGSNIEPEANIGAAVRLFAQRERVIAVSTFYLTESIPPGGPDFINGVLLLETERRPRALKVEVLTEIETRLRRTRSGDKNAPRSIDCDLLLYGDEVVHERGLVLPSPEIETRAFVAIPLFEIAPDLTLPESMRRIADVCASVPPHPMWPLAELTNTVRRELKEANHGSNAYRSARPTAHR
jgi:2-amino-4-hydroxy-6-hydroxymethyldihydropteridine diphosphokinase